MQTEPKDPCRTIISPGDTILIERSGDVLVRSVEFADSIMTRFCGLMFRKSLPAEGGLWLSPCSSIHMMFMRFTIDVVWLDNDSKVLKTSAGVLPWIGMASCYGAKVALELPAGRAQSVQVGDQLIRQG